MLISKKNRKEVYKYLFQEGVLFAEKDFNLPAHPELPDIPNLQVIKLMQSFKSKEYVTELFAWRHYYWFLTDEGVIYLREYLNLPSDVVPATQMKSAKPLERGPPRGDNDRPRRFEGRDGGYRDGGRPGGFGRGGGGEKGDAPGGYRPEFSSGFGRGAAPPS